MDDPAVTDLQDLRAPSVPGTGVMVLVVAEDGVQAITGFQDTSLFGAFGLSQTPV
ncbi:MAG: hypothetical protein ACRDPR_14460 [Nocardioidaceae bacterium]